MIIVFDLDDTLYEEVSFVKSGFKEVANYLTENFSIPQNETFNFMIKELQRNGRGKIFDTTLKYFNYYSIKNVRKCLSLYRLHKPHINLYKSAEKCLNRLKNYRLYIVTDGNKVVQKNKIDALNLSERVNKIFITHKYGLKNAKPSPYCFNKIAKLEKVQFSDIVYVADNPSKDFIEIKKLGFKTIRVLTGQYKSLKLSSEYEADKTIYSLDKLTPILLKGL